MRYPRELAFVVLAALGASRPSFGQAPGGQVVVPQGGGQALLGAKLGGTDLLYKVCAQEPCAPSASDGLVHLPKGLAASSVALDVLAVGQGRHVLWAHAPTFGALIAAVPNANDARVLWSGTLGYSHGEPGEQSGEAVQVTEPEPDGTVNVLLGDVREDVGLCGRPSLLTPRVLDARDLAWKGAMVQRLTRQERDKATNLTATRLAQPRPAPVARLLQATAASSAIGAPGALTDGDPNTTWSEKRGGDGRGEFVQMNVPEQAEISALSMVVRPPEQQLPKGVAPKKVWLATGESLYAVALPDDAWAHAGAEYEIRFPSPIHTHCLALVLDEAYTHGRTTDIDVTVAELTAWTELDQNPNPSALAGALAGGGARAKMAASILTRAGTPGFQAVIDAYPKLDDAGRVLALEVIDNAPCETSTPLYVAAMSVGKSGEVRHALDRVARCGRSAAPALVAALPKGGPVQAMAIEQLALVAPDLAVPQIVALLPAAAPPQRVVLRAALARATQSEASSEAVRAALERQDVPPVASIDLLRAVRLRPELQPSAQAALVRLSTPSADFRTRYLLLGPTGELARGGDSRAQELLSRAISADPDPHVRAKAAETAVGIGALGRDLLRAASDPEPRVRDAALIGLGQADAATIGPAVPNLVGLVRADPWTFVRVHAADVLARSGPDEKVDRSLADALGEEASPVVRAREVEVLGRRRARAQASVVRERLEDNQEDINVRLKAARALGHLCDPRQADLLVSYARDAAVPGADAAAQSLGLAAVAALGELAPADLAARLGPFMGKGAPPPLQQAAKAALGASERCPR